MILAAGTRIRDYEVIKMMDSGGMGEVYLAREALLNRKVAIKCLLQQHVQVEHFHQRFISEAASRHSSIIPISLPSSPSSRKTARTSWCWNSRKASLWKS